MDDDPPRISRPDWPQADVSFLDSVRERVSAVRGLSSIDPEKAHSREDDLYRDVLDHIARTGEAKSATLAMTALETQAIIFPRWSA